MACTRRIFQQAQTEGNRVDTGLDRQLIDEHFGGETVGGKADAAQRIGAHAGGLQHALDGAVGQFIGRHLGAQ